MNTKSFPLGFEDAHRRVFEAAPEWCFQRDDCVLKMMDVCRIMWETGGCQGCSLADDLPLAASFHVETLYPLRGSRLVFIVLLN